MRFFLKVLFSILFLFLFSQQILADAKIFYLKGNVQVQRDGKLTVAKKGDEILDGDNILTGTDSLCIIQYSGNSKVKIDPESNFQFELIDSPLEENETLYNKIKLITGSIVVDHPNKEKKKELEIEAESVSFGVRGTRFFVGIDEGADQDVYMSVDEGVVEALQYNQNDSEEIRPGKSIVVEGGKRLTRAEKFQWQKGINFSFNTKKKYLRSMFRSKKIRKQRREEFLSKRADLRKRVRKQIQAGFLKRRKRRQQFFQKLKGLRPAQRREVIRKLKGSGLQIQKKMKENMKDRARKRIQNRRDLLRRRQEFQNRFKQQGTTNQ